MQHCDFGAHDAAHDRWTNESSRLRTNIRAALIAGHLESAISLLQYALDDGRQNEGFGALAAEAKRAARAAGDESLAQDLHEIEEQLGETDPASTWIVLMDHSERADLALEWLDRLRPDFVESWMARYTAEKRAGRAA